METTGKVRPDGRNVTEWSSKRRPIAKIMPSGGCKGDTVPLAVGRWCNFHEFGCHLGNVGSVPFRTPRFGRQATGLSGGQIYCRL